MKFNSESIGLIKDLFNFGDKNTSPKIEGEI
jgi:hypothetical protein